MKKKYVLILLIFLLSMTIGCQQGEEPTVEKEAAPSIIIDNVISADGVSIAYEARGEGEPVLFFVHGWSNNRGVWDYQLDHFSQSYRVAAIDLAGFGDSENSREEWTMEAYGEDVDAVLKEIDLRNVILIGFSMGAPAVIEAALLSPERVKGIVLVDFPKNIEKVYAEKFISSSEENLMNQVTDTNVEKVIPSFINNAEELAVRYVAMVKDAPKKGWRESIRSLWQWCNESCVESLQQIEVPVTSINGDYSPTNVEAFQKYVPSYKAKIITGSGHIVHWEFPDEFNRRLEEAIEEFVE